MEDRLDNHAYINDKLNHALEVSHKKVERLEKELQRLKDTADTTTFGGAIQKEETGKAGILASPVQTRLKGQLKQDETMIENFSIMVQNIKQEEGAGEGKEGKDGDFSRFLTEKYEEA